MEHRKSEAQFYLAPGSGLDRYFLTNSGFIYAPGGPSDLETMKPGFGYWVKVEADHPEDCVWDVDQLSP